MINELRLEVQNMEEDARKYKTNAGKALESVSSDAANLSKTTEETLVQLETPTKGAPRVAAARPKRPQKRAIRPCKHRLEPQCWELAKQSTSYHDADRTSKTTTAINGWTVQHICC